MDFLILIAHNFYQADVSAYHLSLCLFLLLTLFIENKKKILHTNSTLFLSTLVLVDFLH